MNAKLFVFVVAFLLPCSIVLATDSALPEYYSEGMGPKVPGTIFYAKDGKAICYDFTTKLERQINGPILKDSFGVSPTGKNIVWVQDSKIYSMDLPNGTPRPIKVRIDGIKGGRSSGPVVPQSYEDFICKGPIKNMAVSTDGYRIMFEGLYQKIGWVFANSGSFAASLRMRDLPDASMNHDAMPLFVLKPATINGIFSLSTGHNAYYLNDVYLPRYGNVTERPWARFCRSIDPEFDRWVATQIGGGGSIPVSAGDFSDPEGRIYPRRGVAKCAYYPVFKEDKVYFLYQTVNSQEKALNNQWQLRLELLIQQLPMEGLPMNMIPRAALQPLLGMYLKITQRRENGKYKFLLCQAVKALH